MFLLTMYISSSLLELEQVVYLQICKPRGNAFLSAKSKSLTQADRLPPSQTLGLARARLCFDFKLVFVADVSD